MSKSKSRHKLLKTENPRGNVTTPRVRMEEAREAALLEQDLDQETRYFGRELTSNEIVEVLRAFLAL